MGYRVQTTIPYFTNIPTDVVTNTLYYEWGGGFPVTPTDLDLLANANAGFFEDLYDNGVGNTSSMGSYMRPLLTTIRIYDNELPTPNPPVFDQVVPLTVGNMAAATLPTEVATVLSFQGDPVAGIPQARRRGRIYIGGLGQAATAATTTTFVVPSTNTLTNMTAAASTYLGALTSTDWTWCVYSRVNDNYVPVTNGWMDNAFDTQRRRGQEATARTVWS